MIETTLVSLDICSSSLDLHRVDGNAYVELVKIVQTLSNQKMVYFPGAMPTSIERKDVDLVRSRDYVVAEKTDGLRMCMMFCRINGVKIACMFDRKMTMYLVPMNVPRALFQGTIFDGELCVRKDTGKIDFLIFDAVSVSGIPVVNFDLERRLDAIAKGLTFFKRSKDDIIDVYVKRMFRTQDVDDLKKYVAVASNVYHTDGFIFTPIYFPNTFGRNKFVFKLKTGGVEGHTIDFVVDNGSLTVYDPTTKSLVKVGRLVDSGSVRDGSVAECHFVKNDAWKMKLIRDDKKFPNDIITFERTMVNIKENLELDDVITPVCK
jgi:hypothetical protein